MWTNMKIIMMRSVTSEAKEDSLLGRRRHLRRRSRHRCAPSPNSSRSDSIRIGIRRKRGSPLRLTSAGMPRIPNSGHDEIQIVEDFDLKQFFFNNQGVLHHFFCPFDMCCILMTTRLLKPSWPSTLFYVKFCSYLLIILNLSVYDVIYSMSNTSLIAV